MFQTGEKKRSLHVPQLRQLNTQNKKKKKTATKNGTQPHYQRVTNVQEYPSSSNRPFKYVLKSIFNTIQLKLNHLKMTFKSIFNSFCTSEESLMKKYEIINFNRDNISKQYINKPQQQNGCS